MDNHEGILPTKILLRQPLGPSRGGGVKTCLDIVRNVNKVHCMPKNHLMILMLIGNLLDWYSWVSSFLWKDLLLPFYPFLSISECWNMFKKIKKFIAQKLVNTILDWQWWKLTDKLLVPSFFMIVPFCSNMAKNVRQSSSFWLPMLSNSFAIQGMAIIRKISTQ